MTSATRRLGAVLLLAAGLLLGLSLHASHAQQGDKKQVSDQGEKQNGQAGDQGEKQNGQAGEQGEKQNGQQGDQGEKQNGDGGDQGAKQSLKKGPAAQPPAKVDPTQERIRQLQAELKKLMDELKKRKQ